MNLSTATREALRVELKPGLTNFYKESYKLGILLYTVTNSMFIAVTLACGIRQLFVIIRVLIILLFF
jgi:hypothetical protein